MKVLSFITAKGGCGKSSLNLEIATVFGNMFGKEKVLVIDLDQQQSLSKNCGADLTGLTIFEALNVECNLQDAIQHNDLFDIIPASSKLANADKVFLESDEDEYLLSDLLNIVQSQYDWVFIDPAPSRNILQKMLYIAADYIIIPSRIDESSIDAVVTTQNELDRITSGRKKQSNAQLIGYVINEYNKQSTLAQVAHESIQQLAIERDAFVCTVASAVRVSEAKTFHTAVTRTEKSSKTGREYYAIANQILERIK